MWKLRCAWMPALAVALGFGCRPEASPGRAQPRSAQLTMQGTQACQVACQRSLQCGLRTEQQDCQAQCEQDPAGLQRCAMLDECSAFAACQAKAQPQPAPSQASLQRGCQAQCEALAQCQQARGCEAQRFAALAVPGCETPTEAKIEPNCLQRCRQSATPCSAQSSCQALETCAETQFASLGSGGLASSDSHAALSAPPTCHDLCDRALRCGIEASGATSQEQDRLANSLPAALLDSQTECLMQCKAEFRSERRADFDACLGESNCNDFIECANEL